MKLSHLWQCLFVALMAILIVGLPSVTRADTTPPSVTDVIDDGDYTSCPDLLHASWSACEDLESGIARYEYAIGTFPGETDVVGWTSVGTTTEAYATGLTLWEGMTYYFTVKVVNGAGLSSIAYSDGITFDTTDFFVSVSGDNTSSYPGGNVPMYEKYELSLSIYGIGTEKIDYNPYNPNVYPMGYEYYNGYGASVDAMLTSPSGRHISWPCFWYEGTDGWKGWKLRFAPTETGIWKIRINASTVVGVLTTGERTFQCVTGSGHGFVQVDPSDRRYYSFTDGSPLYVLGTNLSGYSGDGGFEGAAAAAFPEMSSRGANFSRVFFTSSNIEPYNVGDDKCQYKSLNLYWQSRCRSIDNTLDLAHQYGIYLEWVLDDWTYIKDSSSQYIRPSGCWRDAPAQTNVEFFSQTDPGKSREIYKRKLRYWMARWGYSTNLLAVELINELDLSDPSEITWHNEMGNYIHSFSAQPHMVTSSNGSCNMATDKGIDWSSSALDFMNFHDYAKYSNQWPYLHSPYDLEKLGIYSAWPYPPARGSCDNSGYPWVDSAVWVDRTARVYKKCGWNKPMIWSEFGLIYRDCNNSGFPDWNDAYAADPSAEHFRSAIWASIFSATAITHWKLDYILGTGSYSSGGDKLWILSPVANFMQGEIFRNLTQETAYSVTDPLNPNPQIKCLNAAGSAPQSAVMVMALHNNSRAYLYVKNLTNAWARLVDPTVAPTPTPQSALIQVCGMQPGSYVLETWSTTDTNKATQKTSAVPIAVGSDGIARITVTNLVLDVAYKIKPQFWLGLKNQPDGTVVGGAGAIVSAAWADYFYIEADSRFIGIRVSKSGHGMSAGMRADVAGTLRTNSDGERYIEAISVSPTAAPNSSGSVKAMLTNQTTLGGGDLCYSPTTGAGQCGVVGGKGLNNIGLLMSVYGYVKQIDPLGAYFYVDDGSGVKDGTRTEVTAGQWQDNVGVRVNYGSSGIRTGDFVFVAGISSCFKSGGSLRRLILPRTGDIIDLNSHPIGYSPAIKSKADGQSVKVEEAVVTAAWPDYFYVESESRNGAIRVQKTAHGVQAGWKVDITGTLRTNANSERYIDATSVVRCAPPNDSGVIKPISMNFPTLCGGDCVYDAITGAGQKGVDKGIGLNNIGMLVRVFGVVSVNGIFDGWYYLDDGSRLSDGTQSILRPGLNINNTGVRIQQQPSLYYKGDFLAITGIISCFKQGSKLQRVILPVSVEYVAR